MPDTPNDREQESSRPAVSSVSRIYGADWLGLDTRAMRARVDLQRQRERAAIEDENARRRREDDLVLAEAGRDAATPPAASPSTEHTEPMARPRPRPTSLVERLYIENLRSLAGPHEIPLAPLTLVYGPNSSGKSTVLRGLKLFMEVVDSGRDDALHAWRSAFGESGAGSLITYAEPEPEDPSGFSWRSPLVLGTDFRTRDGKVAHAELTYDLNPVGSIDVHSSAIGVLGEEELSRKRFIPEDFADDHDPFHAGDFGPSLLSRFVVEESRAGGAWSSETRVADAELFAHEDRRLQSDLFEMAYLLRYRGPHRGEPGKKYDPARGVFNSGWFDLYRKPRLRGVSEYDVLNQMLQQLEIPYEFERDPLAALRAPQDPKWIMKDTRSRAPVTLDQVGYGVSQLLPVIDDCVHAQKQLICIEEPELHLHPRLQARLGNLFATAVVRGGNQVILETHSEHILLRVQRLIRSGRLRPEEVAVLYVDNSTEEGATVRRLRLDDDGDLLDRWPGGFFDDRLADVLGIPS